MGAVRIRLGTFSSFRSTSELLITLEASERKFIVDAQLGSFCGCLIFKNAAIP